MVRLLAEIFERRLSRLNRFDMRSQPFLNHIWGSMAVAGIGAHQEKEAAVSCSLSAHYPRGDAALQYGCLPRGLAIGTHLGFCRRMSTVQCSSRATTRVLRMSGMIGIGIIGAGYWGPKHVRNFNELPGTRATMVADLDS